MKKLAKKLLSKIGFEIKRVTIAAEPGSSGRSVGRMDYLLEDLKKRGLKCRLIMDVGANNTGWSRMAKQIFAEADFVLIEPQAEMKNSLENFCSEYAGSFYKLSAAGAQKKEAVFTVWDDLLGSSFITSAEQEEKTGNKRVVEIDTIDNILSAKNLPAPALIKLDIQGYELEALKGAAACFGNTEVFIMEISLFEFGENMPVLIDVINFMADRGYAVYDFPGFLRRPFDGALGQCDVCFVKKNGFLRKNNNW